ncbi:MAG: cytidylate kinase family protein [Nitrososphaerales archaeon]
MISGMPSVGKTTAAKAIADKFTLRLLAGGDMLKEIAIERGYALSGSEWWDGEEGMRFLSERKNNPDFDREVDRRLIENVKGGGVVITSYTVPWICDAGLKIWFGATQNTRARRLAGRDQVPFQIALKIVRHRDSQNRKLYKNLYGIKFGTDLSIFNYVIDTDNLSAKEVAAAACELVRRYVISLGNRHS